MPLKRHSLPQPAARLVGREAELERACDVLRSREARLLTLTGPGGAGKTRLALAAAAALRASFPDGAHFVPLEPVRDPATLPLSIAQALRVPLNPARDALERVRDAVDGGRVLLVLDNCEHLPGVGEVVAALLSGAPGLSVLATSRELLRVRWEHVLAVAPFEVPDPRAAPLQALRRNPAIALFALRATAVRPDFLLHKDNLRQIAAVCTRLDGLPLAIELAASGVATFEPDQLLDQLNRSALDLPVHGGDDLPVRQRTLRDVTSWSYGLLPERERALFARLAVCAGGWSLELARALDGISPDSSPACSGTGGRSLEEALASLVSKNLVRRESSGVGGVRYRMLETIRAFAMERLVSDGDLDAARAAHLAHMLEVVVRAAAQVRGRETTCALAALDQLEAELENVRAALRTAGELRDPRPQLRLCAALSEFWEVRGHQREGMEWAEAAVARAADSALKARALGIAGRLARQCSAYARGQELFRAQLATATSVGDESQIAEAQHNLGVTARARRELAVAKAASTAALERRAAVRDERGRAVTLSHLGDLAREEGQLERARTLLTEALRIQAALGDRRNQSVTMHMLAAVEFAGGQAERAEALHHQCLTLQRQLGDRRGVAVTYRSMCAEAAARGDLPRTLDLCAEGIQACEAVGERWNGASCLAALALVLWQNGAEADRQRAACLLGAAEALRRGSAAPLLQRAGAAETLERIQGDASLPPYAAAWARGQGLTFAEARAEAMASIQAAERLRSGRSGRTHQGLFGTGRWIAGYLETAGGETGIPAVPLTPREWEVAELVTRGYTDRQVAEALVISAATATVHVKHILGKLGFTSRAQIAAWAISQTLEPRPSREPGAGGAGARIDRMEAEIARR